jgi:hypothetical protein
VWRPVGRTLERAVQTNLWALLPYLALLSLGTTAAARRLPCAARTHMAAAAATAVLAVPVTLAVASAFGLTGT